jgi:hypothetical protein
VGERTAVELAVPAIAMAALVAGCIGVLGPEPPPTTDMEAWEEGRSLFEQDPAWRGGDGAQSLLLEDDRVLWLFGDSLVDPDGDGDPAFVHNTVAIQAGTDPARGSFEAAWGTEVVDEGDEAPDPLGEEERTRPTAFFPNESEEVFYWPAAPALVEDGLVVFSNRVRDTGEGPFGFEAAGWRVFEVSGHERSPEEWSLERVDPAIEDHGYTVGIAALVEDGYLYAYGQRADDSGEIQVHEVALFRWAVEDVREGHWGRAERWTGDGFAAEGEPEVVAETLAASFTAHRIDDRVILTTLEGLGTGTITLRAADQPQGPFSDAVDLHEPPRGEDEDRFQYAARLHPELDGERVVTWHDSRFDRPRMAQAASSLPR